MNETRNVNYDLMRVIAMLFVIGIHVTGGNITVNGWLDQGILTLFLVCNPFFFMMSGKFNLRHEFKTREDYKSFFYKRFCTIVLPFLLYCILQTVWKCYRDHSFTRFFSVFYAGLMITNNQTHLWFLYDLIGFLISTPLLSKALHAMKDWELNILFWIIMVWNTLSIFLTQDINPNIQFPFTGWMLWGWITYYFLGYYLSAAVKGDRKKWYIAGFISFLITVTCQVLIPDHFLLSTDYQPCFILFACGFFLFFENEIHIQKNKIKKMIEWIAKYSFYVYLFHAKVIEIMIPAYLKVSDYGLKFILVVFIIAAISVVISILFDYVILKPIQWMIGYRKGKA